MRLFTLSVLVLSLGTVSRAEYGQGTVPPAQGQQGPGQGPQRTGSALQIWDDRVFELEPKAAPPTTRKSANGTERYLGEDADYNQGQRNQWLAACESLKNEDLRAYRECIASERRKSGEKARNSQAEVEGRTSLPLRNVPAPLFDSERGRNPAFDVQVERQEEK